MAWGNRSAGCRRRFPPAARLEPPKGVLHAPAKMVIPDICFASLAERTSAVVNRYHSKRGLPAGGAVSRTGTADTRTPAAFPESAAGLRAGSALPDGPGAPDGLGWLPGPT